MYRYSYRGPVMIFDRCIADRWEGVTMASSEKKARSNLMYQFKKQAGLDIGSRISLPGKVSTELRRVEMGVYWVYEVINMLGLSEGLFAACTSDEIEAEDRIMKHLEYPARDINFVYGVWKYSDLPAGCTIV